MRITGKKKVLQRISDLRKKKSYFGSDAKKKPLFLCVNNLTEALSLKCIPRIVDLANVCFKLQ